MTSHMTSLIKQFKRFHGENKNMKSDSEIYTEFIRFHEMAGTSMEKWFAAFKKQARLWLSFRKLM